MLADPFQPMYASEQDAAFALLQNACSTLLDCGVNFAVIGGWVPFLFHRHLLGHPGTFDVDVLLHSSSLADESFDIAAERLLASGYLRAVKNKFQAHRILRVGEEDFVFHIDFLNECNTGEQIELVRGKGRMHSIYTEAMEAVFKYEPLRKHESLPGVRFPSPETFLVSKASATKVQKRTRDAFDAYITVLDQDPLTLAANWQSLQGDGLFRDASDHLRFALDKGDAIEKIQRQVLALGSPVPSAGAILKAFSFLEQ